MGGRDDSPAKTMLGCSPLLLDRRFAGEETRNSARGSVVIIPLFHVKQSFAVWCVFSICTHFYQTKRPESEIAVNRC
jgi:hypothetical protein